MTLFSAASRITRALPPSRAKVRAGRGLTALAAVFGADPVCVSLLRDGSRLRLDLRSRTEAGAFWEGVYEEDYVRLLIALAGTVGPVVYDVGANVGLIAVPVARSLPHGGRMIAFEPVKANFDRLLENVALNGLGSVVTAFQTALGSTAGDVPIALEVRHGAETGNAVLLAPGAAQAGEEVRNVPMQRLDDVVHRARLPLPHVVKVDVEGAEVAWLRGSAETLRRARPVILAECNSGLMPRFGTTFLDVPDLLPPDYVIFSFVSATMIVRRVAERGLGDVLLAPREKIGMLPLDIAA